jgi:hypothetical protein
VNNPWKLILPSLLLGFLLGGLGGSWAQRHAFNRLPDTERALAKLTGKLGLDAAQQTAARAILEERRTKMAALRQDTMAKSREIKLAMRDEIRKILKPEQTAKYDAMSAAADAKMKDAPPHDR